MSQDNLINVYADDFVTNFKKDMLHVAQTYMRMCFRLYEAEREKYYEALGYPDIYSCAEGELDISKSAASRMISICKKFSRLNGYRPTMFVAERYKDYNFSQLCEMVTMKDDDLKFIKPEMTVKDIREVKNKIKSKFKDTLCTSVKSLEHLSRKSVATSQQENGGFEGPKITKSEEEKEDIEILEDDKIPIQMHINARNPEITKKDVNDMYKYFEDIGYLWLMFSGVDWKFHRFDINGFAFIICYEKGLDDEWAIASHHIYHYSEDQCFDDDVTLVSRNDFIENLLHEIKGDLYE